ncbi:hypothetical protein M378DRAFT_12941 [Amanita muscaria Koide BX008]|uniref:Uncharacterized protein n=1 Tax=Amanita muscaria (strain Koide BX008) TaxID=946122 RepID=A0A0C2WZC8_AMAMK|nr:hypothetical protein M378DRAFT_12941 [Amanita muscaria Koide BX008]
MPPTGEEPLTEADFIVPPTGEELQPEANTPMSVDPPAGGNPDSLEEDSSQIGESDSESSESHMRLALEAALNCLDMLKNMDKYRAARWNDKMTGMHQEKENVEFTLKRLSLLVVSLSVSWISDSGIQR